MKLARICALPFLISQANGAELRGNSKLLRLQPINNGNTQRAKISRDTSIIPSVISTSKRHLELLNCPSGNTQPVSQNSFPFAIINNVNTVASEGGDFPAGTRAEDVSAYRVILTGEGSIAERVYMCGIAAVENGSLQDILFGSETGIAAYNVDVSQEQLDYALSRLVQDGLKLPNGIRASVIHFGNPIDRFPSFVEEDPNTTEYLFDGYVIRVSGAVESTPSLSPVEPSSLRPTQSPTQRVNTLQPNGVHTTDQPTIAPKEKSASPTPSIPPTTLDADTKVTEDQGEENTALNISASSVLGTIAFAFAAAAIGIHVKLRQNQAKASEQEQFNSGTSDDISVVTHYSQLSSEQLSLGEFVDNINFSQGNPNAQPLDFTSEDFIDKVKDFIRSIDYEYQHFEFNQKTLKRLLQAHRANEAIVDIRLRRMYIAASIAFLATAGSFPFTDNTYYRTFICIAPVLVTLEEILSFYFKLTEKPREADQDITAYSSPRAKTEQIPIVSISHLNRLLTYDDPPNNAMDDHRLGLPGIQVEDNNQFLTVAGFWYAKQARKKFISGDISAKYGNKGNIETSWHPDFMKHIIQQVDVNHHRVSHRPNRKGMKTLDPSLRIVATKNSNRLRRGQIKATLDKLSPLESLFIIQGKLNYRSVTLDAANSQRFKREFINSLVHIDDQIPKSIQALDEALQQRQDSGYPPLSDMIVQRARGRSSVLYRLHFGLKLANYIEQTRFGTLQEGEVFGQTEDALMERATKYLTIDTKRDLTALRIDLTETRKQLLQDWQLRAPEKPERDDDISLSEAVERFREKREASLRPVVSLV